MTLKSFRKLQTDDRKIMAVQEAVASSLNAVLKIPHLDGVLVENVSLTTAGANVAHMLGRQPVGWIIVDKSAAADVWRTAWDTRFLSLDASATVTVSVWVY